MDEKRLVEVAEDFGLTTDLLQDLLQSRLADRKESLMAAAPTVWGLRVWVSGVDIVLLDAQGFICSTRSKHLAIQLCQFESTLGVGALRALLRRPVVDPYAAVFFAPPPKRLPMPENKPSAKGRRVLEPSRFQNLLDEM